MSDNETFADSVRDQAVYWLTRLNSGALSAQERERFDAWLKESEAHRAEFQQALEYWDDLAAHRGVGFPELSEARTYGSRRRSFFRLSIATCAMLFVAVAVIWNLQPREAVLPVFETARGEQTGFTLADGTHVELNTDSRLRVEFSEQLRRVVLERGEAFFSIGPDDERPFEVAAGAGRIRDIGTQFNVHKYGSEVSVAVLEGEVVILGGNDPYPVAAGRRAVYDAGGVVHSGSIPDASGLVAWREGRIVFQGTPIHELVQQLGRYHDARITIDGAEAAQMEVSGSFRVSDFDGLLRAIETMLPVEIEKATDRTVRISRRE